MIATAATASSHCVGATHGGGARGGALARPRCHLTVSCSVNNVFALFLLYCYFRKRQLYFLVKLFLVTTATTTAGAKSNESTGDEPRVCGCIRERVTAPVDCGTIPTCERLFAVPTSPENDSRIYDRVRLFFVSVRRA